MSIVYDDDTFMEDAYAGTGGFKTGMYLIEHPRETDEKYTKRQELSYYLNYVGTVIDSHVDPIFREEPKRAWDKNNKLFEAFSKDVDTNGTSLTEFIKQAARQSAIHGISFIALDNCPEQPDTLEIAVRDRKLPYAYIIDRNQIQNYILNQAGRITSITYTVNSEINVGGAVGGKQDSWTWTEKTWKVERSNGKIEQQDHSLGIVPIIPLFSKSSNKKNLKPLSKFYSIAKTNKRIFNLCSEIDELIRNQAFNVFLYPVGPGQDSSTVTSIIVGTENVLAYDGTMSNAPSYIAPDSTPLEQLRKERYDLIQEIYRMAQLSLVTGVKEEKSGAAKEWDYNSTNQVLADFASSCRNVELKLATIFEKWTNTEINYTCVYNNDFGIIDVMSKLNEISTARDLNIGGEFDIACNSQAAGVMFRDLVNVEVQRIIADVEKRGRDIIEAESSGAILPPGAIAPKEELDGGDGDGK